MSAWLLPNNPYEIFTMKLNHACVAADSRGRQGLGLSFSFLLKERNRFLYFLFSPEDQTHMYLTTSLTTPPWGHQSEQRDWKDCSDHMTSLCHEGTAGFPAAELDEA